MHIASQASTAFCYLYNDHISLVPLRRESEREVGGLFRHPFTNQLEETTIPFHAKDQRTLLVFDGDLPWQSISKHADQVLAREFGVEFRSAGQVRKNRPFEEGMPPSLCDTELLRCLTLTRRFLLVPVSTGVVRKYVPENFGGRYSFFSVERQGEKSKVIWQNSSY